MGESWKIALWIWKNLISELEQRLKEVEEENQKLKSDCAQINDQNLLHQSEPAFISNILLIISNFPFFKFQPLKSLSKNSSNLRRE